MDIVKIIGIVMILDGILMALNELPPTSLFLMGALITYFGFRCVLDRKPQPDRDFEKESHNVL